MIEDAIKYPMSRDDWKKQVLIGGLLLLFSWLLFPLVVLAGYYVEVVRRGGEGDDELPTFERWGSMVLDGIQIGLVGLVYLMIVLVLTIFVILFVVLDLMNSAGFGAVDAVILFVWLFVSLTIAYIAPAALANFAKTHRMSAAFDITAFRRGTIHIDYMIGWVVAGIILFAAGVISVILAITILGLLLLPFVGFYTAVVVSYVFGRSFKEPT